MRVRYCCLLAAAALCLGCGKAERNEAVTLCKVLQQKRADFTAANAVEKDFVATVRTWDESIIAKGGGRGAELTQNGGAAKDLAASAGTITTQLSQIREAINNVSLHEEYPQGIRTDLINKIMRRQRLLQEVRVALQDSAAGFADLGQSRAYNGDTYPGGIDKLNGMVQGYQDPDDALGKAVADLKAKYKLTDADLGS